VNKTLQALDELFYSIVVLIPTWLGMLKSTRVLTALGTAVAVYLTATQAGLSGSEAVIAAIVEAVTGVSLIVGKTIRSGAPANGQAGGATATTISKITCPKCGKLVDDKVWCSECNAVLHPSSGAIPQYSAPPRLQDIGANEATLYLQWLSFDKMLAWDLTKHDPQVRMVFAVDILNEYKSRLDAAWTEELQHTKASTIAIPTADDFASYDTIESFKKKIMDITPECEWLSIAQDAMLRGYLRYFRGLLWITRLFDMKLNWSKVNTINDIAESNFSAVS